MHPDSTTAERDLLPYWNDYTGAISSHLWLPTATDSPGSGPNSSSKSSSKTVANSWFSTSEISAPRRNSPRIYSPSLLSSLPEPTDSEGTGRKSRKIRIYPDRHQRAKLKLWSDASRFTYNRTIELLTTDGAPNASWLTIKKDILTRLPDWTKPAPYEVKSHAIRDACLAISAAKKFNRQLTADKAKGLRQEGNYARAHFRSRRDDSQTIFIHASALSHRGVYHTILGELKRREPIPHAHGDAKLTLSHHQYHLSVPFKKMGPHLSESNLRSQAPDQVRVVALDPGVRNFITWFSEDGCGKLGEQDFGRIQRLCQHQDNLLSRAARAPSKRRRNMRRAAGRMTVRIQNLINELHHKTARYLVENFDVILLPDFKTSGMVTRSQRRIRSKTVRNLLSFAHHRFRNFLRHKASENGRTVLIVNEAYTSKTVSWTGEINHKLGGRKTVSVLRRTEDGPGPQRRTRDIPARFGRYPLPETARLRVRRNKPQRLLAKMYPSVFTTSTTCCAGAVGQIGWSRRWSTSCPVSIHVRKCGISSSKALIGSMTSVACRSAPQRTLRRRCPTKLYGWRGWVK